MSEFAKVVDGVVTQVILADGPEFVATLIDGHLYIEVTEARKHRPGPGWGYDAEADGFYPPRPGPEDAYILDRETMTWTPTQAEQARQHNAPILDDLARIDTASIRPARAVAAALAAGQTPPAADVARLAELETQAAGLRATLL